ncbi:RsmE family RNA methyltransferase [Candidatus Stoquefichus massiliensis]|uniref:RsmE family RNA methyltransferase n=1 Tax=Candidatus Stoquefichus massiliensis TaxID=1470350 RepID=UPI00048A0546|nr:RsmE family RNA methyltransferase [Candidatus Stoquefichus massiliensis]
MQRYFIDENCIHDDLIMIDTYNHKHMQKVMRYRNGNQVVCILPHGQTYLYEITDIEAGILRQKELINEDHELDVAVTLIYGLPKNDKFEFVLQKATELGVQRIVPFLSKRSIIKTDAKTFAKKTERYQKILKEASEQSYRQRIPELTPLITMKEISQYLSDINLVAYEESSKQGEHHEFAKALQCDYQSLTIIVGPEGGFDESEIIQMEELGIVCCSLGKRILRSETAPLYMLSVIGYSRELMK